MSDLSSSLVAGLLAPTAFALLDLPIIDLLAFAVVVGKTLLDNFKIELFNGKKKKFQLLAKKGLRCIGCS